VRHGASIAQIDGRAPELPIEMLRRRKVLGRVLGCAGKSRRLGISPFSIEDEDRRQTDKGGKSGQMKQF